MNFKSCLATMHLNHKDTKNTKVHKENFISATCFFVPLSHRGYTIKLKMLFIITAIVFTSCKKDVKVTPKIDGIEPTEGTANTMITVTGSGLQNINSAVLDLDNVQILVNSNFNTSTAILLRVPANANSGKQHVVFTNSSGYQYSLPFTVY